LKHLHYGWTLVTAASCIGFMISIIIFTFGVFLKPLAMEFGTGRAAISLALALSTLLGGVFGIGLGRLTDRYGPRILTTFGGILAGLGLFLMWQVNSIWQIYLFYGLLMAIGLATFDISILSTIPRWFTKRRGVALSITHTGYGVGGMVLVPLAQWLISSYGWRQAFFVLGLATLVIIIPLAQFMKYSPQRIGLKPYGESETAEDAQSPASATGGLSFAQSIKTGHFWLFGLILFCFFFSLQLIVAHIAPQATDIGISAATAAGIIAVIAGTGIIGKLLIGPIADKIGYRLSLSICLVGFTIALLGFLFAEGIWMFYLFAVIFGITYGGAITLPAAVAAELFGLKNLGVIYGAAMIFSALGMTLGPIIAGSIFDMTGNYSLAFLICVIISALSILLSLLLLRYKGKEKTHNL